MKAEKHYRIIDYSYDSNGRPCALRYKNGDNDPVYYYYKLNSRGDVIGLYKANGTLQYKYEYDVWGNILSVKNASGVEVTSSTNIANLQSLKYRGYVYDYESGLYYFQSRYFDPVTHRFLNADGLVSTGTGILGYNMFAYCENNPVNYCDLSGDETIKEVQQAVAGNIPNNYGWTIKDATYAQKAGLNDSDQFYKVGTTSSGY